MSELTSHHSASDIHICGQCRSEFYDIYKFIDHKQHCTANSQVDNNRVSSLIDNVNKQEPKSDSKQRSEHSNIHSQVLSVRSHQSLQQNDNGSMIYPSPVTLEVHPQQNEFTQASNISYENIAVAQTVSNFPQIASSSVIPCGQPNEHNVSGSYFEIIRTTQNSTDFSLPSSGLGGNIQSSQEIPSDPAVQACLPDSTVDSSGLCPEDLEVGQISEAMLGKLSQKFCLKGHSKNRKLKDGSEQGRALNPISTLAVHGEKASVVKEGKITSINEDKLLSCRTMRMNSSSVPLTDSGKCSKIFFEKRERLQGVSDELLDPSPIDANYKTDASSVCFTANRLSKTCGESFSCLDRKESVKSVPNQSSVYKAVFTSPSSGGHRLAVHMPDSGKAACSLDLSGDGSQRNDNNNNAFTNQRSETSGLEKGSKAINYLNISKLNEYLQNPHQHYSKENDQGSVNQKSFQQRVRSVAEVMTESTTTNNKTAFQHQVVFGNTTNEQDLDTSTLKEPIVEQAMSISLTKSGQKCSTPVADIHGFEMEVSSSTDQQQTVVVPWSAVEVVSSESGNVVYKDERVESTQISHGGREETLVFVYKQEDDSVYMMYKPDQVVNESSVSSGENGTDARMHLGKKVFSEHGSVFAVEKSQGDEQYELHSVVHQPRECFMSQVGEDPGHMISEYRDQNGDLSCAIQDQHVQVLTMDECSKNNEQQSRQELRFVSSGKDQSLMYVRALEEGIVTDGADGEDLKAVSTNRITKLKDKSNKGIQLASMPAEGVPICPNTNQTQIVIDSQKTEKSLPKIFTCKFGTCSYSTSLAKDLQRHYRTHTGERPFHCDVCGKTFNRSDKLKTHLRFHSGLKPFQCKVCSYATVDSGSLKKHMRIHTDERPFQCQICPYASRNSSQLIVHLRTHTGDAPFHCNVCSAQFKIKSDLKRHVRVHTGEKPYGCDKCDYRSTNKGNLKTHYKINHSVENEKSCPKCSFVTSSLKRLREHIKIHDEARIVKCGVCQYTCNSSAALRSHMMVHTSLRPYRCTFCPYSSKQSGNLKKHVQNVHQEKQRIVASTGSKLLSDKSRGRKRHKSRDTAVSHRPLRRPSSSRKIHSCHVCGSGFVRQDSLRCHLKQHQEKESVQEDEGTKHLTETRVEGRHVETDTSIVPSFAPPPPPPPSLGYRRQGLDHIVAAASKLYREQYGEDGDSSPDFLSTELPSHGENNERRIHTKANDTTNDLESVNAVTSDGANDFSTADTAESMSEDLFSDSQLVKDNNYSISTKEQKIQKGRPKRKWDRSSRLLKSSSQNLSSHDNVPWEHESRTVVSSASSPQRKTKLSSGKPSKKVFSSSVSSKILLPSSSSSSSSLSLQSPLKKSVVTSIAPKQTVQPGQVMQPLPPSKVTVPLAVQNVVYQVNQPDPVARLEPQTVSIQVLPQMDQVASPVSQVSITPQAVVGQVQTYSHPTLHSGQPAVQILLPTGSHMTQIIPTSAVTSGQPQIMFQVQAAAPVRHDQMPVQAQAGSVSSLSGPAPGQQLVLGQCPSFSLVSNPLLSPMTPNAQTSTGSSV